MSPYSLSLNLSFLFHFCLLFPHFPHLPNVFSSVFCILHTFSAFDSHSAICEETLTKQCWPKSTCVHASSLLKQTLQISYSTQERITNHISVFINQSCPKFSSSEFLLLIFHCKYFSSFLFTLYHWILILSRAVYSSNLLCISCCKALFYQDSIQLLFCPHVRPSSEFTS